MPSIHVRAFARILIIAGLLALSGSESVAQSDGMLHLNDDVHRFLERQQSLGNLRGAFLDEQPLSAYRGQRYLDSLAALVERDPSALTADDRLRLGQFRGEIPLPGAAAINRRFGGLYKNGTDFFSVEHEAFRLQVNPKLYLSGGMASETDMAGETPRSFLYQNTRAVRLTGGIGDRFFFHSQVEENQRIEPMVGRERTRNRLALAFQPDSSLFDYMLSSAAIGYRDRYVEIQLGRGQQRWGPGMGSLYYSNHAPPHTWVQARLEVWRLSYTAHYTVLDDAASSATTWQHFRPVKYGVFHRFGLSLPGRLNVGFFDGIIFAFQEEDRDPGNYIQFLNPLIFLNAVDKAVNSPGNVLVGLDAHWTPLDGMSVYGQFILDDFEASELFFNGGYWKNTWGWLAGAHLVDLGLPGTDLRVEYSRIRPYVYANVRGNLAHTHRYGYLGSPSGPNSQTLSVQAAYSPFPQLRAGISGFVLQRGRSTGGLNYGEDPHVEYIHNRVSDNDVYTLQGIRQTRHFAEARLGYQVLPAFWLDGVLRHETFADQETGRSRGTSFLLQLRWGMPAQHPLY